MKKILITIACSGLLLGSAAQAIEGNIEVGKNSTNLNLGIGTQSPGLFLKGNWLRSDHDGSASGVALGYNLNVGSLSFSPAAKALYTHPEDGKGGVTFAVGSGIGYQLNNMWGIYGEYFYAPKAFSDHLDNYKEAAAGISFTPISLLSLRAGYQYVALNNKNSNPDNVLVDGPYISASVNF